MTSSEHDNRFLLGLLARMASARFSSGTIVISHSTSRVLAYLALALASFTAADGAGASVGSLSGAALSALERSSPAQRVQFSRSNCYYDDGWNGRGWYRCGDEWNDRFGWVGPLNAPSFSVPLIQRRHRHDVVVAHPQAPKPIYSGAPSRRPVVGVPSAGWRGVAAAPTFGRGPWFHQFGAGGVHPSRGLHAGAVTVPPGFAGGGFHGGLGGGNFHQFHSAGIPHIGAPVAPHFAGVGGFHGPGAVKAPHIGAPVAPHFAGVGVFHGPGAVRAPHIGAPASPGLARVHGVGGAGVGRR